MMAFKYHIHILLILVSVSAISNSMQLPSVPYTPSSAHSSLNNLRQNSFLEWISSIFRPPSAITTTTTPSTPARECPDCTCGTINTIRRIVGGQETEVHQYPWMALLMLYGEFSCGATLINDLYVATAAHCVSGLRPRVVSVRLLEHNQKNSSVNIIERQIERIDYHEKYSAWTYDNDIAVLRLKEPVEMTEMLRPVCMPSLDNSFAGETAIITGWGAVSEGGPISDTLQEVMVPILSQEECRQSNYGSTRITDNMLCAGVEGGGMDSCQGDSGGPLHVVMEDSMDYQLAGIVSWGEGCARPNSPGVYTRVSQYSDWIEERTRNACSCHPAAKKVNSYEK